MLLLTTLLSALLVTISAAPAQAHDAKPTASCTGLNVNAWAYDAGAPNRVVVTIDGVEVENTTFEQGFTRDYPWTTTEDHTYRVQIFQGNGSQYNKDFSNTSKACEVPPPTETGVTTEPTFQDACGPEHRLSVPEDTDAYRFTVADGTRDGAGSIVVTATLNPGYVWTGGSTKPKTWTFAATNEACAVEVDVPAAPTLQDVCGPDYGQPTLPANEAYTWSVDDGALDGGAGTVTITATLNPGSVWTGGGTEPQRWTYEVTSAPCVIAEIPAPTALEVCGPDGDAPYELPADGERYRYVVTDPGTYTDGQRVITVDVVFDEGWAAPEGAQTSWTFTVSDQPCDTPAMGLATADVIVTPATCSAPGTAAPGVTERASWTVSDVPTAGGTATLVAVAEQGAAFEAGLPGVSPDLTTRTFTLDVPAAGGDLCTVAPPPVQPPTDATPPTTPQSGPPTLPRTGFDLSALLAVGTLLALAGAALVARRARTQG